MAHLFFLDCHPPAPPMLRMSIMIKGKRYEPLKEPVHPGEVLKELYLDPIDMGAIDFARRLDVPRTRIERLIKGVTSVTPDTALRLDRAFNKTPAYWMNMLTNYDMSVAFKVVDVSGIEPLYVA